MANVGWIKLHRKILEWEWATKPLTFRLFIHILLNANTSDSTFRGHFIPAGSFVAGRIKLAQECGMSEREVRTALNHLKSTNEVTIKATNEFSIISIVCWNDYQSSDQPNANERPTKDQRKTTDKEYKNIRIKEDSIGIEGGDNFQNQKFEEFWLGWKPFDMDKGSKANAEKFYNQAIKETSHETIIGKRDEYIKSCHSNQRKTTHASTWLNPKGRRGWADDYAPAKGESLFSPRAEDVRVANRVHATSREIDRLLGEN